MKNSITNKFDGFKNPSSVTELLEKYSGENIIYSPIANNSLYNIKPAEMIALQTNQLTAFRRYGFLRGERSGVVYAKVESITLDIGFDLNNNIPLGKMLIPLGAVRHNLYSKEVRESDEAGNNICYRITALMYLHDKPVSFIREWIYE